MTDVIIFMIHDKIHNEGKTHYQSLKESKTVKYT